MAVFQVVISPVIKELHRIRNGRTGPKAGAQKYSWEELGDKKRLLRRLERDIEEVLSALNEAGYDIVKKGSYLFRKSIRIRERVPMRDKPRMDVTKVKITRRRRK